MKLGEVIPGSRNTLMVWCSRGAIRIHARRRRRVVPFFVTGDLSPPSDGDAGRARQPSSRGSPIKCACWTGRARPSCWRPKPALVATVRGPVGRWSCADAARPSHSLRWLYGAASLLALSTWRQNVAYFRPQDGALVGSSWRPVGSGGPRVNPASTSITVDLGLLLLRFLPS